MIHIRPANHQDIDTIAGFNIAMADETEGKTLPPHIINRGVERILADRELGFYTVAEVDREVAAALLITTEWSDWRDGFFWWIQSVYVAQNFRRQGVFAALYRHIHERASSEPEVCGLRLYVEKHNASAQQTYLSLGMIETDYRLFEEEFVRT